MSIYQTESVRRVTGKNDGESILINIAEHSLAFPLKWTEHEEKHKKISFEILLPYSTQFNHSIYVYLISETLITGSHQIKTINQMKKQGFLYSEVQRSYFYSALGLQMTSRHDNRSGSRFTMWQVCHTGRLVAIESLKIVENKWQDCPQTDWNWFRMIRVRLWETNILST